MSTTKPLNATLATQAPTLDISKAGEGRGSSTVETVIRANPGWIAVNWEELYQSHELFYTLVLRDLMVRYKQTVLGVAWAIIQPVFTMVVFTVIFGRMLKIETPVPYPLFVYAALVPWTFFNNSVNASSMSLLTNQNLLTKIYFPRLFVPAAVVGGVMVDMLIALGLFAILMPYYHFAPTWNLLGLPVVVALTFVATLGVGLTLAALTILYRDLRFVIPFALQLLLYVSGVIGPMTGLSRPLQYLLALNPMYGLIGGFRSAILGMEWDFGILAVSTLSTVAVMLFGLFFFRRTERLMADIV